MKHQLKIQHSIALSLGVATIRPYTPYNFYNISMAFLYMDEK